MYSTVPTPWFLAAIIKSRMDLDSQWVHIDNSLAAKLMSFCLHYVQLSSAVVSVRITWKIGWQSLLSLLSRGRKKGLHHHHRMCVCARKREREIVWVSYSQRLGENIISTENRKAFVRFNIPCLKSLIPNEQYVSDTDVQIKKQIYMFTISKDFLNG